MSEELIFNERVDKARYELGKLPQALVAIAGESMFCGLFLMVLTFLPDMPDGPHYEIAIFTSVMGIVAAYLAIKDIIYMRGRLKEAETAIDGLVERYNLLLTKTSSDCEP